MAVSVFLFRCLICMYDAPNITTVMSFLTSWWLSMQACAVLMSCGLLQFHSTLFSQPARFSRGLGQSLLWVDCKVHRTISRGMDVCTAWSHWTQDGVYCFLRTMSWNYGGKTASLKLKGSSICLRTFNMHLVNCIPLCLCKIVSQD
jgi:hypothetical protein